mgnify:CR=1 FL=1
MSEDKQPVFNPHRIRLMRGEKLTEDEMELAMGGYIEDDDQCKGVTREEFDDICQRLGEVESQYGRLDNKMYKMIREIMEERDIEDMEAKSER